MKINWIKITDKNSLPKLSGRYLVTTNTGYVQSEFFCPSGDLSVGEWINNYVAWCHYPESYSAHLGSFQSRENL